MNNKGEGSGPSTFATMSLRESIQHIADPDRHSGGASAAAVSAAHAAATAQLVTSLNGRRGKNPERAAASQRATSELVRIHDALLVAADDDSALLSELMAALAARKSSDTDRKRYRQLLADAAASALAIAELIVPLLDVVEREQQQTSAFLVSDLGAAVAIASGAIDAALFTVIANAEYLHQEGELNEATRIMARARDARDDATAKAEAVRSEVLSRYAITKGVDRS
ncbi:MAG: cyclodeaminase/cyclohydrolase family protein [Chloroflexota bacterium]